MAKRLFHFIADNGSGRYRVQVVNAQTNVVLVANGYPFDINLTGQPTQGRVEGFFDNVPVGTVIPAGYKLRTVDLASPTSVKDGPVSESAVTVCAAMTNCDITNLTRSAGSVCQDNQKNVNYGFSVTETGDFKVSVIRFDSGAVIASEIHTALAPGPQTGNLPVPMSGMFPETGLYIRIESTEDNECVLSDSTNLLRIPDTFSPVGTRWTKNANCAAVQKADCNGTYRVAAVNCSTGTILPTQPADWPIQFISQNDAEVYLGGQGYSQSTEPVVSVAPTVLCGFGNIRKVAYENPTTYFVAVDDVFGNQPTNFSLVNGDGTVPATPIGTLLMSEQTEDDAFGVPRPLRYLQMSILTTVAGTASVRLRGTNSAGSADYTFSIVTISRLAFQIQNLVIQALTPLLGRFNLRSNLPMTGVFIAPQGACINETPTTPIPLLSNGNLPAPLSYVGSFPIKKRGFYSLTFASDGKTESITTTIPAGDGQFLLDTRRIVEPTAKIELVGHYNIVADTPTTPTGPSYEISVDVNDCDKVRFWIADRNNPGVPATGIIYVDDVEVARVTAKEARPEVRDYLRAAGYTLADSHVTFDAQWNKPASLRDDLSHQIRVTAVDGTAARYNVPQTSTCAAPVDNTPILTRRELTQNILIREGQGAVGVGTREYLSNNTDREYTGTATYRFKSVAPGGVTLTPVSGGRTVNVAAGADSVETNITLVLEATYPDGGKAETTVQVINTGCTRPAGQDYSAQLVYNFRPVSNESARLFSTLDDANNTMGAHFDNTAPGTLDPFKAQFANYNVGSTVYLGWGSDCAVVSDNIYYVLNGDLNNGQKIAIQVAGGKIVSSKVSSYTTPTAPAAPEFIGSMALNVVFNTSVPFGGPAIDFQTTAKLVTVGVTASNQSVERSTDPAVRFKLGSTVATAGWLAAPQQSQKTVSSGQKYDSFAFALANLKAAYPSATTLAWDIITKRRADPETGTFNSESSMYRVLIVRVSTNRTFGLVSQALNVATGADYNFGGPTKDIYEKTFLGDGVKGVLIPAGQEVVLGRVTINLDAKTAVFTESIDVTP